MRIPARRTAQMSRPSWATPEAVTPQASEYPALGTYGVSNTIAAIENKLNSTGAAAAAANWSSPFKTPENKAVRQIRNK